MHTNRGYAQYIISGKVDYVIRDWETLLGVVLLHVAAQYMKRYKLAESDIPGASLKGRQPNDPLFLS